jgi:hypothetical protein
MHFSLAAWSSPAVPLSGRAREAEACGGRGGQRTSGMLVAGGWRQRQGNQSVVLYRSDARWSKLETLCSRKYARRFVTLRGISDREGCRDTCLRGIKEHKDESEWPIE